MRSMIYPALLWATVLIALLGSFQFGMSKPSIYQSINTRIFRIENSRAMSVG